MTGTPQRIRDTAAMIAGMAPRLREGRFVFCTVADAGDAARLLPLALAAFREDEGVSLVIPVDVASAEGLAGGGPVMAWITLDVVSALDGVGLTAAVSGALAREGIACNTVAAFHHDHVFVPEADAPRALSLLQALARG